MIKILDKRDCCGCYACAQICPHKSIVMEVDSEGFFYPSVDYDSCVDCHLCEKVCPVLNPYEEKMQPLSCYLGKTNNEVIRFQSSSGGIFTEIANYVIGIGGVVFGVRFDNAWNAVYDYTEKSDGIGAFRGSKYIQANPGDTFIKARDYLNQGRIVLFTGTPCVIAGLNHFLHKYYNNLITVDVVCHSIPSPKIWQQYIREIEKKNDAKTQYVTFRDKSEGWTNYSLHFVMKSKKHGDIHLLGSKDENVFMRGFLNDLFTKPSCSKCPARNYKSRSDMTIADAWGINEYRAEMNDEKGMSHILINTVKGGTIFNEIADGINYTCIPYQEVEPHKLHSPLTNNCKHHPCRNLFFKINKLGFPVIKTTVCLLEIYNIITECKRILLKSIRG